ncbi:MAG TPA: ABC transporter permease [Flavobacteriales bacterium]|nr:ABC transporter permease [Flavobacteriales bacterium]
MVEASSPWWRTELGEVWEYRDLVLLLVRRDLLATYKQSVLGPLWQVIQPVLTALVFAVVFGFIGRGQVGDAPPVLFYMAGIVPWMFFANVINRTSQTLVWNAALMTKVYFPRLVAPLATTLATMVGFLLQLLVFGVMATVYQFTDGYGGAIGLGLVALPVLILLTAMLALGLGLFVAGLTARYRDLGFLVAFGVQLLMYASPVIFPLAMIPEGSKVRDWIVLNPMSGIIEGFRSALLGTPMDWSLLAYPAMMAVVILVLGLVIFQRIQRSFADVI